MLRGERRRGYAPAAAVGPSLVVVDSPLSDGLAGLLQRLKPILVKTLITKRAVEALDVRILGGTAWLDEDVLDVVLLCPCHEGSTGELWPVVGSDLCGVAPKHSGPVE